MKTLFREPGGTVVLKSNTFALRFFPEWGGCPREFWSEPFPRLTNPYPGSAASLASDRGQDPTQASSDGETPNPIARIGDAASTLKYNYYGRETMFLPNECIYGINLFMPDFWLSHEAMDDFIPVSNGDHGWRTAYSPGIYSSTWKTPSSRVIFDGPRCPDGFGVFLPGNQLKREYSWNDVAHYPEGRFAGKTLVSFYNNNQNSVGGLIFRKDKTDYFPPTAFALYAAAGYSFTVNSQKKWTFSKTNPNGTITYTKEGALTAPEALKLYSNNGLELEVRTHNGLPGYIELYIEGRQVYVTNDTALPPTGNGSLCGLYANSKGVIQFDKRRFFDVSTEGQVYYKALDNKTIQQKLCIRKVPGADSIPAYLSRAGFGVFMDQNTFPTNARFTYGIRENGAKEDIDGKLIYLDQYKSFWVGNEEGTIGLKATPQLITIDDKEAEFAHCLLQKHSFNDEFYMGFNPLPPNVIDMPLFKTEMTIDWTVTI